MSDRRAARANPARAGRRGLIPDGLRMPPSRERLGWSGDELLALIEARKAWYAENGFDYRDWRTRQRVERGE